MALLSLIAVLLIEQVRPLPYRAVVYTPLACLARFLEERFNAGEHSHGIIAWLAGVGGLVIIAGGTHAALHSFSPTLAWAWNVLVLYLTMGFRQFSHFFTDIQLALRMDDLPHARELLAEWRGIPADGLSSSDIARLSIQEALKASHLHVFGVLLCFMLFPGPSGAVLYRASEFFASRWGRHGADESGIFGRFSRQAFSVLDWFPSRMTAAGFAVVGNFETAMYRWKTKAKNVSESPLGIGPDIVLAAGYGALGLNMDPSGTGNGSPPDTASLGVGDEADLDFMQSAVGLVWRALVLWMLLLLLLSLASIVRA
ncbi:MAG: CobD/CbiB family protein [Propionivibrio sp.]